MKHLKGRPAWQETQIIAPRVLTQRPFSAAEVTRLAMPLFAGRWPKSALAQAISQALSPFMAFRQARKTFLTGAHWGAFEAIVDNGKLIGVQPLKNDPFPNELIAMAPHQVHATNRVKYPMVRKSWLEGGPENCCPQRRGSDEWVRVSWDKALTLISNEISRLQKNEGPQAIHAGSYGWKSVGLLHNSSTLLQRLMNLTGGFLGHVGDYSAAAAQVIMPHVIGSTAVYEAHTSWENVIENSTLIVMFGCNAKVTLKNGWHIPNQQGLAGFAALKKKGTRVISVDPLRNETAKYLNAQWIALRPYTDSALLVGIAHTLMAEKRHDCHFLAHYTVGFEAFADYVNGKQDGVVKNADWAAEICGVSADAIRTLSGDMANHRTMIMAGWGIQRQHHGEQTHWLLVTEAAMLGQIGLPGGGFGFSFHCSSGSMPKTKIGRLTGITAGKAAEKSPQPIPVARIADCLLHPGKTIHFNGSTVTYPQVKMMYIAGGNPLHHHQDTNKLIGALRCLQTIVVNEPYWTATAKYADIVLPATTSYERNDLETTADDKQRCIFPMYACVPAQDEARNDFTIFAGLAKKLGVWDAFTQGRDERQWLEKMYDDMKAQAEKAQITLPSFESFWRSNRPLCIPLPQQNEVQICFADFRKNPLCHPLGTPSGKIEICSETLARMNYEGCRGIPGWFPPYEWYKSRVAKRYPLSLNTAHPANRLHSQLDNTPLRKKYAVAGREAVWIHPDDAAKRAICNGDVVRAWNDRGQILVGAVVTEDVRKGVVRISEGAWFDPADPQTPGSLCKNGNVNCLTFDLATSELAQGNCGQMTQLEIEKYEGPLPQNTAHNVPAGA